MRLRITLILIFGLVSTGCGGSASGGQGVSVVAAFYPLAFAAQEIVGAGASVSNLTPPGAEPHDLELSPQDVARIQGADIVLLLGHGFQPQVERAAEGSSGSVLRLLDTPGLDRVDHDPHVWLDPLRYAVLVRRIGVVLHRERAADRLEERLRTLNLELRRGLSRCVRHEIVTSHAAFGYLSRRYGLEQISIEGLSPEAEPTPTELRRVAGIVRRRHVTTIYFETLVSPKLARTLARETETKTAILDPLEGLTPEALERREDYFSVMRSNLASLREGLGCR